MEQTPAITIAIPTHNRPDYLREALASVAAQTRPAAEVVLVDDASDPPVDLEAVGAGLHLPPVRLLRNDTGRGLAWNRNEAVRQAGSDFVLHLDDDDRLAPQALERVAARLAAHPETEVAFLSLYGFGDRNEHFNRVQPEGTRTLLSRVEARTVDTGCVAIDGGLPGALLTAVPQSFQHPVVRRTFWHEVTALRNRAYAAVNGINEPEAAFALVKGPLRDSEWAIYGAFLARHVLLIQENLYEMRCEGQGAVSRPEQRQRQTLQSLDIKRTLAAAAERVEPLIAHRQAIRAALRTDLFNAAWYLHSERQRREAWRILLDSGRLGLQLRHLKLGLRMAVS